MRLSYSLLCVALLPALAWGCNFPDQPPENISISIEARGAAQPLQMVFATQFVAGVNELGVTQVQLILADTMLITPPFDTTASIAVDRRFFVEALPEQADSAGLRVQIQIDGRDIYDEEGQVFPEIPFRFVYLFNQPTTRLIEVF